MPKGIVSTTVAEFSYALGSLPQAVAEATLSGFQEQLPAATWHQPRYLGGYGVHVVDEAMGVEFHFTHSGRQLQVVGCRYGSDLGGPFYLFEESVPAPDKRLFAGSAVITIGSAQGFKEWLPRAIQQVLGS